MDDHIAHAFDVRHFASDGLREVPGFLHLALANDDAILIVYLLVLGALSALLYLIVSTAIVQFISLSASGAQ